MRYGQKATASHTLFPLAITAIKRTPEEQVELTIGRFCGPTLGDSPAGSVFLSPAEAATLAGELQTLGR
jgi:hypothetical protein